jgi:hypothetical protein
MMKRLPAIDPPPLLRVGPILAAMLNKTPESGPEVKPAKD